MREPTPCDRVSSVTMAVGLAELVLAQHHRPLTSLIKSVSHHLVSDPGNHAHGAQRASAAPATAADRLSKYACPWTSRYHVAHLASQLLASGWNWSGG